MFLSSVNCYLRMRAGNRKEFQDMTDYVRDLQNVTCNLRIRPAVHLFKIIKFM